MMIRPRPRPGWLTCTRCPPERRDQPEENFGISRRNRLADGQISEIRESACRSCRSRMKAAAVRERSRRDPAFRAYRQRVERAARRRSHRRLTAKRRAARRRAREERMTFVQGALAGLQAAGWRDREVARQLGVSRPAVGRWRSGGRVPSRGTERRVCELVYRAASGEIAPEGVPMDCPQCEMGKLMVDDTKPYQAGAVRRRRACNRCGHRVTTFEFVLTEEEWRARQRQLTTQTKPQPHQVFSLGGASMERARASGYEPGRPRESVVDPVPAVDPARVVAAAPTLRARLAERRRAERLMVQAAKAQDGAAGDRERAS